MVSKHSDIDWVARLIKFIKSTYENKPHIKFTGICFGHQVIAHALGGEVKNMGKGTKLGLSEHTLLEPEIWRQLGGRSYDSFGTFKNHTEAVMRLPEGAIHLASTLESTYDSYLIPD